MVYQAEKQISELGDKLPADKKDPLEAALGEAKQVLENQDAAIDELKAAKEKLVEILQSIGQDIYQSASAESGDAPSESADSSEESEPTQAEAVPDEDVVDADFEVVDEDKKKN